MHYSSGISRISFFVTLILLCVFGNTTSGLECGGHITAWSGKITSPNYPDRYPDDSYCVWVLKNPNDLSLGFELTYFDLGHDYCTRNYLKIKYVNSTLSRHEIHFCRWMKTPYVIRAPVSWVRLEFKGGGGLRGNGFEIKFYVSADACPPSLYPVLCRNNRCKSTKFICDGDNDCGDNSDEEYCDGRFQTPGIEFIANGTEPDGTQTNDYKTETVTYVNEMTEIGTVEYETETTKYETETTEFESVNTEIETLTYVTTTDKTLHIGEERTRRVEEGGEIYSPVGMISGVTVAFVIGISMVGICIYKGCQRRNTITSLGNPVYQACAENVVINRT